MDLGIKSLGSLVIVLLSGVVMNVVEQERL